MSIAQWSLAVNFIISVIIVGRCKFSDIRRVCPFLFVFVVLCRRCIVAVARITVSRLPGTVGSFLLQMQSRALLQLQV
jgi:hypothetical protein